MMKKIIVGIFAILGSMLIFLIYNMYQMTKLTENITFHDLDLTEVKDGKYRGDYHASLVSVQLEVIIQDHHFKGITILEHKNGLGKKAELIIEEMISQNTIYVDTISKATISSKVIQKAVESALES